MYNHSMRARNISLQDVLKEHGQSVTRPRLAVFEALLGQEPMTMHELVGEVSTVDRASVYRTIELFERLGIVQRLHMGWKYKLELTDTFAEHHHHLTCMQCDRTIPMNEIALEHIIDRLAAVHHFRAVSHQIEIQGYCSSCSKKIA